MAAGTITNQNATLCIDTTNEVQVGYYNGKPLYRKYFTGSLSNITRDTLAQIGTVSDATFTWIDVANSFFQGANNNKLPPYINADASEGWIVYYRNAGKSIMIRSYFPETASGTFYVAALYTKT